MFVLLDEVVKDFEGDVDVDYEFAVDQKTGLV